jgi:hypothetical protein
MDRQRHIQWTVSADDLSNLPLGYRIELFEDRYGERLVLADNSFDDMQDFEYYDYEGLDWVSAGSEVLPAIATPVRYRIQSSKFLQHIVIAKGEQIHRLGPYGRHLIETRVSQHLTPRHLAVDASTNEIWITDNQDRLFRFYPLLSKKPIVSPMTTGTMAVIPDLARNHYWVVTPTEAQQRDGNGRLINAISFGGYGPITRIVRAEISRRTGDLMLIADGSANGSFLHAYCDGSFYGDTSASFLDFIPGGYGADYNAALLVSGTAYIHLYDGANGMLLDQFSLTNVTSAAAIAGEDQEPVYVYDSGDNVLRRYGPPAFGLEWEEYSQVPTGVTPRFYSHTDMDQIGRLITWWGNAANGETWAGCFRDLGGEGVYWGRQLIHPNTGPAVGAILQPFIPAHAWTRVTAVTNADGIWAPSSSSETSTSTQTA